MYSAGEGIPISYRFHTDFRSAWSGRKSPPWFSHEKNGSRFLAGPSQARPSIGASSGLEKGDVVMAVRGIRVFNLEELVIARDLVPDAEVKVIVWRDGSYRECDVKLAAEHHLGFKIASYRPGKRSRR